MSDLLEPFRRAAELGCQDFGVLGHTADFKLPEPFVLEDACSEIMLPAGTEGAAWFKENGKRINRYAANVCECWWREHAMDNEGRYHEAGKMIDLCREFARKHGGQ